MKGFLISLILVLLGLSGLPATFWSWSSAVIGSVVALGMLGYVALCAVRGANVPFALVFMALVAVYHIPSIAITAIAGGFMSIERLTFYNQAFGLEASLATVSMAILACASGYLFALRILKGGMTLRQSENPEARLGLLGVLGVGFASACIGAFLRMSGAGAGGYDDFWDASRGSTGFSVGSWLMAIGYVALAIGIAIVAVFSPRNALVRNIALCGALYAPHLLFGFRGVFVASLVGLGVVVITRFPKLLLPFATVGLIGALFGLPIIAEIRQRNSEHGNKNEFAWWERPIALILETDFATKALVFTINEIEAQGQEVWHARSFLAAMKVCVPFSSKIELLAFDGERERPSIWMLATGNLWKLERGIGEGYSCVAEAYLAGRFYGVVGVFVFVGFYLCWLERMAARGRWQCVLAICLFVWLIWWIRNDSVNLLRPSVWSFLIVSALMRLAPAGLPQSSSTVVDSNIGFGAPKRSV